MLNKKKLALLGVAITIIIAFVAIVAAMMSVYTIRGTGVIVIPSPPPAELKLNVYSDEACTVVLTEIDWESMEPGETKTRPVWVKNLGDVPFTMNLNTQNWDPEEGAEYITLSWDYANETVSVGEVLPVTFRLEVDEDISGVEEFSFDIVITAEA